MDINMNMRSTLNINSEEPSEQPKKNKKQGCKSEMQSQSNCMRY
jgi:hypothetical protein